MSKWTPLGEDIEVLLNDQANPSSQPAEPWRENALDWVGIFRFLYESDVGKSTESPVPLSCLALYKDISFLVGKEIVRAHSFVLQMRSGFFSRTLRKLFLQALQGAGYYEDDGGRMMWDMKPLPISSEMADAESFKALIKFIYTEELDQDEGEGIEKVGQLFKTAQRFEVKLLEKRCESLLCKRVDPKNVVNLVTLYALGEHLKIDSLVEDCFTALQEIGQGFFDSPEFESISHGLLCKLLGSDELNVSESEIFLGAVRWGRAQLRLLGKEDIGQNLREVLDPGHHLIRFPLLEKEFIVQKVQPLGLLNDSELLEITFFCLSQNDMGLKTFCSKSRRYQQVEHNLSLPPAAEGSEICQPPPSLSERGNSLTEDILSSEGSGSGPEDGEVEVETPKASCTNNIKLHPEVLQSQTTEADRHKRLRGGPEMPQGTPKDKKPKLSNEQCDKMVTVSGTSTIVLTNNDFLHRLKVALKLQHLDSLDQVTKISLFNVFLPKRRTSLPSIIVPNLRYVEVVLDTLTSNSRLSFHPSDYLIFSQESGTQVLLDSALWNGVTRICIWENGVRRFELNPADHTLFMNLSDESASMCIVKSLAVDIPKKHAITKLALSNVVVHAQLNPIQLTHLVLHRCSLGRSDFFRECLSLIKLSWIGVFEKDIMNLCHLSSTAAKLTTLSLCNITITVDDGSIVPTFSQLKTLHLFMCRWDVKFESKLGTLAPEVRKFVILASHNYIPTNFMATSFLKEMKAIEQVFILYAPSCYLKCEKRINDGNRFLKFFEANANAANTNVNTISIPRTGFRLRRTGQRWSFLNLPLASHSSTVLGLIEKEFFDYFLLQVFSRDASAYFRETTFQCKHSSCLGRYFQNGNITSLCLHEQGISETTNPTCCSGSSKLVNAMADPEVVSGGSSGTNSYEQARVCECSSCCESPSPSPPILSSSSPLYFSPNLEIGKYNRSSSTSSSCDSNSSRQSRSPRFRNLSSQRVSSTCRSSSSYRDSDSTSNNSSSSDSESVELPTPPCTRSNTRQRIQRRFSGSSPNRTNSSFSSSDTHFGSDRLISRRKLRVQSSTSSTSTDDDDDSQIGHTRRVSPRVTRSRALESELDPRHRRRHIIRRSAVSGNKSRTGS